ncbi:MAG: homoserine dehydrogenase [Gemmataceae bacterium]
MSDRIGIALIGCGTVGGGVAKILHDHADRVAMRASKPLSIRRVVVRDPSKARTVPLTNVSTELTSGWSDPDVQIVVELIGGTTTAKEVVLSSLAAGKHVVTANKALLAEHGAELFAAARKANRVICFEAAVAGGVPIIRALAESLSANQITSIQAILNGTSNFILTAMADRGSNYADALKEAQELGYAEADPTLDVDGSDAAHKLAVLAQIAFGVSPNPNQIERRGIDTIDALDVKFAGELGYAIKLLAEAWASGRESTIGKVEGRKAARKKAGEPRLAESAMRDAPTVALHVAPVMIRKTDMLAQVRGAFNAIQLVGDVVGETLFQGPGAGMMPTASAVVSDLIDIAVGRAQYTFSVANLWNDGPPRYVVIPSEKVTSRFYLRLMVKDEPGVLADVCRALADQEISISSMIQHESQEGIVGVVPLVIMTHNAITARFRAAIKTIDALPAMASPAVYYPVDD